MSLDKTKLIRKKDIIINEFITLKQPTLDEIIDFGEQRYFSIFYSLCGVPSDMKSLLWDMGIDFMKLTDWELFLSLSRSFSKDDTFLIFGDLDLSQMEIKMDKETGANVLVSENCIITEDLYLFFISYIREIIGYTLKREKAGNSFTKQIMIDEDRKKRLENQNKEYESNLFAMIVSLVNTEEFSYTYDTVMDITMYQLMQSFIQIQNKKAACALYQGSMSGFVDTSKIKSSNFQWTYKFNE